MMTTLTSMILRARMEAMGTCRVGVGLWTLMRSIDLTPAISHHR